MAAALPSSYLSPQQIELLLKPIHPQRVLSLKNQAYVAGHDIRAELTRVFGFARWTTETLEETLLCEREVKTKAGAPAWYVVWKSRVRLTVNAPDGTPLAFHDGSHVGESTHPVYGDAHGNALTNSGTYALRRAAINLGDQMGLSLYNKGSLEPIVRWTLVGDEKPADTDDVVKVEAEEQPETEAPAPSKPRPAARKGKAPVSAATTPEGLAQEARDVATTDALRETWKHAGELGFLKTEVTITEMDKDGEITERKLLLQDYLLQRSNDLSFPEGNKPAEGDGDAGGGAE